VVLHTAELGSTLFVLKVCGLRVVEEKFLSEEYSRVNGLLVCSSVLAFSPWAAEVLSFMLVSTA